MKLFRSHKTPTKVEEQSLLERYRRTKNQKWIGQLFTAYMPMVYGVCLRYTPDTSEAEDFVMDVYIRVQEKALTHDIDSFRSWLYVLTKHYCLGELRKVSGKKIRDIDPSFMQLAEDEHPVLEHTPKELRELDYERLERCMKRLTKLQHDSIHMFYFEHKSYAEIAAQLEAKAGQVRSLIQNGRRNLRKCMNV